MIIESKQVLRKLRSGKRWLASYCLVLNFPYCWDFTYCIFLCHCTTDSSMICILVVSYSRISRFLYFYIHEDVYKSVKNGFANANRAITIGINDA